MANLSYWERRQAEDMVKYMQSAEDTAEQIAKLYLKASRYISLELDQIFEKYQTKHGLSEQEAMLLLNALHDRTSINEMLQKLKSDDGDVNKKELVQHLEAPAFQSRLEHFQQLQNQIDYIMRNVYEQEKAFHTSHYVDLANEAYYRNIYNIQQRAGIGFSFGYVDAKTIDQVINSKWSGSNYSQRIWKNTQNLAQVLKEELLINLVTGRTNREVAGIISNKYAVGASVARRLVRTESNYIATELNFKAYKEAEIERYCFLAILDIKTSEVCRSLDRKIFPVSERKTGENCPPMHPWCRSTTVSVMSDELFNKLKRRTRDPETGQVIEIPMSMSYQDWYDKYVKGKPEVELEEKKIKNRSSDRTQWKQYRELLGGNIPDSLDKFQNMKYNERERWRFAKLDYQRHNELLNYPEMKLPDAENAILPEEKFTKYLLGGSNEMGLAKGKAFTERLGYDIDNWKDLRSEIQAGALKYPATFKGNTEYGKKYEQKMVLYGKNSTPANVIVGWMRKIDGTMSMTSAYIKEVK